MKLPAPIRRYVRRWTQPSIACVLCCAIMGGTIGFPTVRSVVKDRSAPFPCQDKPCGCANAASCWKSCCCHTNREKLAWAKLHGVTVPDFVVVAAALEAPTAAKTCCQMAGKCAVKNASPAIKAASKIAPDTNLAIQWIVVDSHRQCQGHPPLWTVLSHAVLPDVRVPLIGSPSACDWLAISSESVCGLTLPPRLRPPRL